MQAGILILLGIAALRFASALILPVAMSLLVSLLLAPAVRWLHRHRMPESIGAALVVFGVVALFGTSVYLLSGPAAEWLRLAPQNLEQAQRKIRRLARPLRAIQQTAEQVEAVAQAAGSSTPAQVQMSSPGLMQRLSGRSIEFGAAALTVIFLTYFLLAKGSLFRRKLVAVIPGRAERIHIERAIAEIELQMSRYLATTTLIFTGVGLATWGALRLTGMPNAGLWGAVAGILNFVPYVGPLVTISLIALASLVAFDSPTAALWPPLAFLVINLIESNFVTPALLGRRLPLNTVALFVGLLFWGWVWGVTGAILAVPLMVMIKVTCDHVEGLGSIGVFLDN